MRKRMLIVLAFAGLVGLVVSALVYRTLADIRAAANNKEATEQIIVAAVNMDLAETVTRGHVRVVSWPKPSVPPGVVRTLETAEGRVVRSGIVAGEPLLEGKLAPQLSGLGGIMPMLVPEGERAVTIKVEDAIKESGFVLPNSRVDAFVNIARQAGSQDRVAKLILQDVRVLAAGQAVEMRDNKPVSVTTVTLSLTPEQAERLALAQNEGRLMLGMRNLKDKRIVHTTGATRETLIGAPPASPQPRAAPAVSRAKAPVPTPAAPLTPKLESHTVAVIRSGNVTEQVFVRERDAGWVQQKAEVKK